MIPLFIASAGSQEIWIASGAGVITALLTFRLFFDSFDEFFEGLCYGLWSCIFWIVPQERDPDAGWNSMKVVFWLLIAIAGGVSVYHLLPD